MDAKQRKSTRQEIFFKRIALALSNSIKEPQCEILVEKFTTALIPAKFNGSNVKLFFNPLCCWSDENRNFKQIVDFKTYDRLIELETNDMNQGPQQTGSGLLFQSFRELLNIKEKQDLDVRISS